MLIIEVLTEVYTLRPIHCQITHESLDINIIRLQKR